MEKINYSPEATEDCLYHHGILGQKWGDRNGPPYPLDRKDYSAKEKKLNTIYTGKKSTEQKVTKNFYDINQANDDGKIYAITSGAGVLLGAGLTAYALSIGDTATAARNAIVTAINAGVFAKQVAGKVKEDKQKKEKENCQIDKKTGFHKKNDEFDIEEDVKRVNPGYNNFSSGTKSNCMLCTMTYDLRRRGYEVTAKLATIGYDEDAVNRWYPNAKLKEVTGTGENDSAKQKNCYEKLVKELESQGNGARGNIMVRYNKNLGGHSVAYEVVDNKLKILDCQTGKTYNDPNDFLSFASSSITYARLDNVSFNTKLINEVAE